MRRAFSKAVAGLAALAAVTVPLVAAAPAAHASPTDVIAIAGSDTTQDVMTAIFNCGADGHCLSVPTANPVYNIKFPDNQTTPAVVPADQNCQKASPNSGDPITYVKNANTAIGEVLPAAGSGAGRNALRDSVAKTYPDGARNAGDTGSFGGCIDIARSSGYGQLSPAHFDLYAFALDAVGISSPSLNAPASMTLAQVRAIFHCDVNDWSQVGGRPGPIQRLVPQAGSGTGDFFMQNILGLGSTARTTANFPDTGASGACPTAVYVEENNGKTALDPSVRNNYQNVILPYSSGKWVYQANGSANPTVDIRGGSRPIALVNTDATTGVPGATPATSVRWKGSTWVLNDASVIVGATYNKRTTGTVTSNVAGSSIVGAAATFSASDIGRFVSNASAAFIPANTTITAVSVDGTTATLNNAPTADAQTGTVLVFDKNRTASSVTAASASTFTVTGAPGTFRARDVGLTLQGAFITDGTAIAGVNGDGSSATVSLPTKPGTYPQTADLALGWSLVSDKNPNVLAQTDVQYAGSRYVYNVLHDQSPSYAEARNLVGFDDSSASGTLSALCSGTYEGVINANGFQALPALDRDGPGIGNDQPRSCVLRR